MLSWKTNLVLIALGLIYPIAMAIRDHNRKKRADAEGKPSSPGKETKQ
jgi:hypothetical protein